MALSDRKRWSARVVQAFGAAHGLRWPAWWRVCRPLFEDDDVPPFYMEVVETREQFDWWHDVWRDPTVDDSFVVMVNVLNTKEDLMAAFEKILRTKLRSKRGRPERQEWGAEFPLRGTPNVQAIATALDVWESKRRSSKAYWEIAKDLKINRGRSDGQPGSDDRRVLAAQCSRYYRQAERLIRGVEQGTFPALS